MNRKLTLTIEKEVIGRAKYHARKEGRSLSDIVESYLKIITSDDIQVKEAEQPVTRSLRGAFKVPEGFDEKKELRDGLHEKYRK